MLRNVRWNFVGVALDDALGNPDVFGVGAVIEEQIFTEVFLSTLAEVAFTARGSLMDGDEIAGLTRSIHSHGCAVVH